MKRKIIDAYLKGLTKSRRMTFSFLESDDIVNRATKMVKESEEWPPQ